MGGQEGGAPSTCLTEPPLLAGGAWFTRKAMPCSLLMGIGDISLRT